MNDYIPNYKDLPKTWRPRQKLFGDEMHFKLDWSFPQSITLADGSKRWFNDYYDFHEFICVTTKNTGCSLYKRHRHE